MGGRCLPSWYGSLGAHRENGTVTIHRGNEICHEELHKITCLIIVNALYCEDLTVYSKPINNA